MVQEHIQQSPILSNFSLILKIFQNNIENKKECYFPLFLRKNNNLNLKPYRKIFIKPLRKTLK